MSYEILTTSQVRALPNGTRVRQYGMMTRGIQPWVEGEVVHHGPLKTEVVVRDYLAETLIRLRDIGLTAVFHVHDEVIAEVDRPEQLDDVLEIMARPLDWAPGLPLKGAGFVCDYYQKD